MKIIIFYFEKKKLFTKEKQESYENAKIYYISQEKIVNKYVKYKRYP